MERAKASLRAKVEHRFHVLSCLFHRRTGTHARGIANFTHKTACSVLKIKPAATFGCIATLGLKHSVGGLHKARFVGLAKVRTQTVFTFAAYKLTHMRPSWAGVCLPYRVKFARRSLKGEEVGKNQPGTGLETSFKVKCGLQRTRGIQVFSTSYLRANIQFPCGNNK